MIVSKCDLCGLEVNEVLEIQPRLQIEGVKHVCRPCEERVNAAWAKMRKVAEALVIGQVKSIIQRLFARRGA